MNRVVIIEDEIPAANRLKKMLTQLRPDIQITYQADSIREAVNYFQQYNSDQLIFMDIHLADGLSFEIFKQVRVTTPVIFITAYDQYAIQAFKVNSIDYLLKPIDESELKNALEKFDRQNNNQSINLQEKMLLLLNQMSAPARKERIMIKRGQQLSYLKIEQIAYFFAEGKFSYAVDLEHNKYILDDNLSLLEPELDSRCFFRINRSLIVHIDSIIKVHTWAGNRLQLELKWQAFTDTIVSREKVGSFKEWLGGTNN
jgi:DNA-binding LytR/AlgR family response regulator